MGLYSYDGPVMMFDKCIADRWVDTTYAVSEKKARSNLVYKYKMKHNLVPNTKVTLPGEIILVDGMASVG